MQEEYGIDRTRLAELIVSKGYAPSRGVYLSEKIGRACAVGFVALDAMDRNPGLDLVKTNGMTLERRIEDLCMGASVIYLAGLECGFMRFCGEDEHEEMAEWQRGKADGSDLVAFVEEMGWMGCGKSDGQVMDEAREYVASRVPSFA